MVNATRALGYYHRVLAPGETYEVVASMPGFRTKSTRIMLEEGEAASVDFILDPEETSSRRVDGHYECNCYGSGTLVVDYLRGVHMEMYLAALVIFVFLYLLLRRKLALRTSSHRQILGQKRASVV